MDDKKEWESLFFETTKTTKQMFCNVTYAFKNKNIFSISY